MLLHRKALNLTRLHLNLAVIAHVDHGNDHAHGPPPPPVRGRHPHERRGEDSISLERGATSPSPQRSVTYYRNAMQIRNLI
ncbi:hypothetical protein GBA52_010357 [Prunus armeniaca]|nr:hypothetical protein GBA52_010357 [Prunus armeniaca]